MANPAIWHALAVAIPTTLLQMLGIYTGILLACLLGLIADERSGLVSCNNLIARIRVSKTNDYGGQTLTIKTAHLLATVRVRGRARTGG